MLRAMPVRGRRAIVIAANSDVGVLYGAFELLKRCRRTSTLDGPRRRPGPAPALPLLNHWDNLDRTVERGYAGFSLWDWHKLPDYLTRVTPITPAPTPRSASTAR